LATLLEYPAVVRELHLHLSLTSELFSVHG